MAKTEEKTLERPAEQTEQAPRAKRKSVDEAIEDVIKRHRGAFERLAKL